MLDLHPATDLLAGLVQGVRDDQLDVPTPCRDTSVRELLVHVDQLALAFAAAAAKAPLDGDPASSLGADWRARIPADLARLAGAWRDPAAWSGTTEAGGIEMPGDVAAAVAIDEIVVHGWDLAAATGQPFTPEPELVAAAYGFAEATVAEHPHGSEGLFGPPVPVPPDAPLVDRLLGLTGRDPSWRPAA